MLVKVTSCYCSRIFLSSNSCLKYVPRLYVDVYGDMEFKDSIKFLQNNYYLASIIARISSHDISNLQYDKAKIIDGFNS